MSNGDDSDVPGPDETGPMGVATRLPRSWNPPVKDSGSERVDVGQLWVMLRERWRSIFACALVLVTLIAVTTMAARMTFKTRGSLYLGELQDKAGPQAGLPDQFDFFGGGNGDVGTEIEILKSGDLVKRAVLETGLNVRLVPTGWTPPRYLRWRLGHRDLDLLDVGTRKVAPTNVSLPKGTSRPKDFTLRFLTASTYEVYGERKLIGTGSLGAEFASADLKATLLAGQEGQPAGGEEYEMTVRPLDQVIEEVNRVLTISMPKSIVGAEQVKVVTLQFLHPSPREAAAFVATLMRTYLDRRQAWKGEEANAAEVFVSSQVRAMKESLETAERALAEYKKGSSVMVLGDDAKGMIDQLARYEEQRMASRLQVASFNQIDRALKGGRTAPIEQYLVGEVGDQVLAGLSNSLGQAQQELTRMAARFTQDAPALREQQAQVDAQIKTVRNYVLGRRARAQEQLRSLDGMIAKFEETLKTVPHAEQQLAQLTRGTEVLSKVYSFLLERQQQVAVVKASTISKNHILDIPEIPYREDSPLLGIRLIAGALAGLLFGVAVVLVERMLATTFQTEKELRKTLGEIPLFGVIPRRTTSGSGQRKKNQVVLPLDFIASDIQSPFAEAFRHLRANIYYSGPSRGDKVILITSPGQGDGKTLCTVSLAAALAADGKHVLVIEGDMHRPSHHVLFDQGQEPGLSSFLTRQVEWNQLVRFVATPYGTFDAITAGKIPPSPAELLSSPQFGALVAHARRTYDFVLIDSPPFPVVSDALVIAMYADRVLTVVRPQNTRRRAAEDHLRRFSAATPRYGVVINDVESRGAEVGYYGYHSGGQAGSAASARLPRKVSEIARRSARP